MRRFTDPGDKLNEGKGTWISSISRWTSDIMNMAPAYALALTVIMLIGLFTLPTIQYNTSQLYPKTIDPTSPLNPYDRGGAPFVAAEIVAQYPENAAAIGYVTSYLTPLSVWFKEVNLYLGTVIAAHPGGIIDEILYYTRGFDTIIETSILFVSFAIASFLFRKREEP
ncbi:MAG: EhaF family protein [Methanomicrobiales archaeon]|jgi:energy-converting hydrogenase A subunit F|nr:EhaF family protein [Methanomicrobiales archaeon]